MRVPRAIALAAALALGSTMGTARAEDAGTAFTYQGQLKESGGSDLIPLSPRQPVKPAPDALYARGGPRGGGGFWAADGDDIYNTNSGGVGIGTSNPQYDVHVYQPGSDGFWPPAKLGLEFFKAVYPDSLNDWFSIEVGGDGFPAWGENTRLIRESGTDLLFQTEDEMNSAIRTTQMVLDVSGNLGIGTSSPLDALHVVGNVRSDGSLRSINTNNPGAEVFLGWGVDGNENDMARIRIGGDGSGASNGLDIQRTANVSLLRILHNGNVGIGTTSPGARLHVVTSGNAIVGSSTESHGVWGESENGHGVLGLSEFGRGVVGISTESHGVSGASENGHGVIGKSEFGHGVVGVSEAGFIYDELNNGFGVYGEQTSGTISEGEVKCGVYATSYNGAGGTGLVAIGHEATGRAAGLFGSVLITGEIYYAAGASMIDHPLDPENRYLYHSSVESPDMKNIYDGVVVTDDEGRAGVDMPNYFQALNRDFRYQLTVMGQFAQAIVEQEIEDNRFTIRTSAPNVKVSWQVTGIRQDRYAEMNRMPVEQDKPEENRGHYIYPQGYGRPAEETIGLVVVPTPGLHQTDEE